MARFITVYNPATGQTAGVPEERFYAKGGLRDKGWTLEEPAEPEPADEPDETEEE